MCHTETFDIDREESTKTMDDGTDLAESMIQAQTSADDGTSGMVVKGTLEEEEDPYRYL